MAFSYTGRRGSNTSTGTSGTLQPSAATVEGATLALLVGGTTGVTNGNVTGVTDTRGNTWTKGRGQAGVNGNTGHGDIWFCASARALSTSDTITFTFNSSTVWLACLDEYQGSGATPLDQATSATATNTSAASGATATTTVADELLLGLIVTNSTTSDTITPSAGWTANTRVDKGATNPLCLNPLYQIVSATGTYNASATLGTSRNWVALITTLKISTTPNLVRVGAVDGEVAMIGSQAAASAVMAEVALLGPRQTVSALGAEVSYIGTQPAAGFVAVEAAVQGVQPAAGFVGIEIAYVPGVAPTAQPRRPMPIVAG